MYPILEYRFAREAARKWKDTKGDKKEMSDDEIDLITEMVQYNTEG